MKKLLCLMLCITLISSAFIFSGCAKLLVLEMADQYIDSEYIDNSLSDAREEQYKEEEQNHLKQGDCDIHHLPDLKSLDDSDIVVYNGKRYYEGGNREINAAYARSYNFYYIGEVEVVGRYSGIYVSKFGWDGINYCAAVAKIAGEENPEVLFRLPGEHYLPSEFYVREDVVIDQDFINVPLKSISVDRRHFVDFGGEMGEQYPIYLKDIVVGEGVKSEESLYFQMGDSYNRYVLGLEYWEHRNLAYDNVDIYVDGDEMIIELYSDGYVTYSIKEEYKQVFLDAIAKYEEWEAQRKSSK